MRLSKIWPGITILLGGCAIHPVQSDVTGIKTPVLVDYIRCETRLAVVDKAVDLIERSGDPKLLEVAAELRSRRGQPLTWFKPTTLTPRATVIYQRYVDTGIAYDFTFDITENNRGNASVDPIGLFSRSTAGVTLVNRRGVQTPIGVPSA
jgi:hypothetical protein